MDSNARALEPDTNHLRWLYVGKQKIKYFNFSKNIISLRNRIFHLSKIL